jgi:aryl-alcohol dehydrogenase-like predicted oxidoreductase
MRGEGAAHLVVVDTAGAIRVKSAGASVTGPIIGPRTIEQLDASLRALQITLDESTLSRLDELFPPRGLNGAKAAPEAYAW